MKYGQILNIPRRFVLDDWGGTETVILETAKQLRRRGYEPEILTTRALSSAAKESICEIEIERFSYSYTRWGLTKKNRLLLDKRGGNMFSIGLFFRALVSKKPCVIHLHTLGRLGALMKLVANLRNIPYVVSIHGGLLDLPDEQIKELIAPTKNSFNWGKVFDWLLPARKLIEQADAIICVGQAEQKKIQLKYPSTPVFFLPNGVDVEYFASGDRDRFQNSLIERGAQVSPNDRYILSVGSFYAQKNQMTLVRAFAESIPKVHSAQPMKLLLIGQIYDQAYFCDLKKLIHQLDIEDSVIILNDISFDNLTLVDAYKASDLFVLPSLYETFGVVVLEAWAAGLPVICGAVGGLTSFVQHDQNGLFCNVRNEKCLAKTIKELMRQPMKRESLKRKAREDVKKYDWQIIGQKLSHIYQTL